MKPKQSIRHIPLHQLVPHSSNVREDIGDVDELAQSIVEHGILQPLVVTEHLTEPDRWLILAGHRRAAAAARAGMSAVPCIIRHQLDEAPDEQIVVMLVENCQRRDLTPLEKADALGSLRNRGLTQADIARRTGMQPSNVAYYLALLELDDKSRQDVLDGHLASTQAIAAVRVARQQQRTQTGRKRQGRPVQTEVPHLSPRHPLAARVKATCTHTRRPKVGKAGCGQCWENTIRADERANLSTPAAS